MFLALLAGAVATVGVAGSDAQSQTILSPSPDTIFSRARDAATSDACAKRLEYEIIVTASANGFIHESHYRAQFSGEPKHLRVARFSDEELANPTVPHGTNFAIVFLAGMRGSGSEQTGLSGLSRALTAKVNNDPPRRDILGFPQLEPFYTFGLRRSTSMAISSDEAQDATFRTIGKTTATRREYAIVLVGIEPLDGAPAYHLRLEPVREPTRFRMRDVWVDRESYGLRQIRTEGNFVAGPSTKSSWLTTYRQAPPGCRYIDRETATGTLDYGRNQRYERTTLAFRPIADANAYRVPELFIKLPADSDDLREPPE